MSEYPDREARPRVLDFRISIYPAARFRIPEYRNIRVSRPGGPTQGHGHLDIRIFGCPTPNILTPADVRGARVHSCPLWTFGECAYITRDLDVAARCLQGSSISRASRSCQKESCLVCDILQKSISEEALNQHRLKIASGGPQYRPNEP